MTKENIYRVTIEELASHPSTDKTIQFEFQDREDLFKIIENLKQGSGLDATQATRVGVSLRLLGPVMMMNRKHPLFAEFMPHFKTLMIKLKNTVKSALIDK
ncbi:DUF3861 domain-containing protein [Photobacterium phosphoreum]|uniref:DUF3861 domain-containing protein n=1 Tax=Photobacterium phosphoreum TaxID=659 RepID=UPI0005D39FEF|nr:DUF3861 domain-containing protein [Photobacterium phosphoreum]KJF85967.1 hypothetical protein UB41_12905 [Photobacterium phosphoreum]PQJ91060.1 hypothetical protein BTO21_04810 [Photobacterium phosphoreum]PSV72692.1 DUF3861 domain-containing protein [Photobacterium phosphoreum]